MTWILYRKTTNRYFKFRNSMFKSYNKSKIFRYPKLQAFIFLPFAEVKIQFIKISINKVNVKNEGK